jgi:hypothetical protein
MIKLEVKYIGFCSVVKSSGAAERQKTLIYSQLPKFR